MLNVNSKDIEILNVNVNSNILRIFLSQINVSGNREDLIVLLL